MEDAVHYFTLVCFVIVIWLRKDVMKFQLRAGAKMKEIHLSAVYLAFFGTLTVYYAEKWL